MKNIPHSLAAEKSVLAAIIFEPFKFDIIRDRVNEDDFFDPRNKAIFKAAHNLFSEGLKIDLTTIMSKLDALGLKKYNDPLYFSEILDVSYTTDFLETYLDILLNDSVKRQVLAVAAEIQKKGTTEDIEALDYLSWAEETIFSISRKKTSRSFVNVSEVIEEVIKHALKRQDKSNNVTGYSTGYTKLDEFTLGFQKESLNILAARTGIGKTALALNIALNVAKRNQNNQDPSKNARIAFFSLEMSNQQLATRMLASESNIYQNKIMLGDLSSTDWKALRVAQVSIDNLFIVFEESVAANVSDIRAKCRQLAQSDGLDFVIIDYLQLIGKEKGNRGATRQEEVAQISRGLKQLARELKIPILALSQLSRDSEDQEPTIAHLRESGAIEQDADVVLLLHRDRKVKTENRSSLTKLNVAKNRHGQTGEVNLTFLLPVSRFIEVE